MQSALLNHCQTELGTPVTPVHSWVLQDTSKKRKEAATQDSESVSQRRCLQSPITL